MLNIAYTHASVILVISYYYTVTCQKFKYSIIFWHINAFNIQFPHFMPHKHRVS